MLAKSKLNRIESKISEELINNEISHDDFMTNINEDKNIENWKKTLGLSIPKDMILKKLS